jgi:hypothetical protein
MNQPDDLEQLWKTQPVEAVVKGEDMRQIIVQKTEKFDRRIRWRNIREYAAALIVVPVFLYYTRIMPNNLARLGCVIVAAGALWIVYYLWRHGTGPVDPLPDQSLESYQRALIAKYDHQIRLLRTVKFWYLLPLYVGLMILNAGLLRMLSASHAPTLFVTVNFVLATVFFAFVWWLNEVRAIRRIKRLRAEVMSATDPGETTLVI